MFRLLRDNPIPPTPFAFGKFSSFGDFVSFNLGRATWLCQVFDELAVQGRVGHPNPWLDLGKLPRGVRLQWSPWLRPSQEAVFIMQQSCDSHGRQFPVVFGWHAPRVNISDVGEIRLALKQLNDLAFDIHSIVIDPRVSKLFTQMVFGSQNLETAFVMPRIRAQVKWQPD